MTENELNEFIVASLEAAWRDKGPSNVTDVRNAMRFDIEEDDEDAASVAIDAAIESLDGMLVDEERENPNDEYDPCSKHE